MTDNKIRNFIALTVVITFLIIISFLTIYPYMAELEGMVDTGGTMLKFLEKTSSLFSGIIGVILGYYFGNTSIKETEKGDK